MKISYSLSTILICIISNLSVNSFALPCPGGGIVYKGDLIETVKQQCGQPDSTREYMKTITVVRWGYYTNYVFGFATTGISVLLQNNMVAGITVGYSNYPSIAMCGTIIGVGNTAQQVLYACGNPVVRETVQVENIPVTVLSYKGPPPVILIFENGIFTDFR